MKEELTKSDVDCHGDDNGRSQHHDNHQGPFCLRSKILPCALEARDSTETTLEYGKHTAEIILWIWSVTQHCNREE